MIALAFIFRLLLLAWGLGPEPDEHGPRSLHPSLVRLVLGSRRP